MESQALPVLIPAILPDDRPALQSLLDKLALANPMTAEDAQLVSDTITAINRKLRPVDAANVQAK